MELKLNKSIPKHWAIKAKNKFWFYNVYLNKFKTNGTIIRDNR